MFPFDFGTGVFGGGLDLPTINTCNGLDAAWYVGVQVTSP